MLRKILFRASLLLACLALLGHIGPAEAKRVALVIGNGAYQVGPLSNPINDATAVAAAFKRLGFDEVSLQTNLDGGAMKSAISRFGALAAGADVAVVYYAGHGLENAGLNYLIPTDARLARAADLDLEAIQLGTIINQIDGARQLKLVILDACRNNVFPVAGSKRSQTRGLARIEPENDTLVAYAAAAGTTADDGSQSAHSPFTSALLKYLETPGLEVDYIFRIVRDEVYEATGQAQRPHVYGSLGRERIYFVEPKVAALAPAPSPSPSPPALEDDVGGGGLAAELATLPGWKVVKRDFPTWFDEQVREAAAKKKSRDAVDMQLANAVVALRRQHGSEALKASTAHLKRLATAFLNHLNVLSRHSTAACYGFISQGETAPLVLDLPASSDAHTAAQEQVAAVFEAIASGRQSPSTHDKAKKDDYDILVKMLTKLGWTERDLHTFAEPSQLAKEPPARVCQMVQDWFRAHLDIGDAKAQERLLVETLKPVVSG